MAHSNGQMEGAGATPPAIPETGYNMADSVAIDALAEAQMEDAWQTHLRGGGLAVEGAISAPTAEVTDVMAVATAEHMLQKAGGARERVLRKHHSDGSHIPVAEEPVVDAEPTAPKSEAPVVDVAPTAPKSEEVLKAERIAKAKAEADTPRRNRQITKSVLHDLVRSVQAEGTKPTEAEAADAYVI